MFLNAAAPGIALDSIGHRQRPHLAPGQVFIDGSTPARIAIGGAAKLMYYGGDLAELLLAIALFWMWYQDRGRLLRHDVQLGKAGADLGSIRPLPA